VTNSDNARSFQFQLDKFMSDLVPEAVVQVHAEITLSLLALLIKKSPVGFPPNWKNPAPKGYVGGQFRSFWQANISGSATVAPKTNDARKYGEDPSSRQIEAANSELGKLAPFSVSYIVNGLPYGDRLNSGWSRQAPAGFIELSIAEVKSQTESAIKKLEAEGG
jgi:hypothetical protein